MAKSLRSKWSRKMRAVKREKNEKRVLKQLKETLQSGKLVVTEKMVKLAKIEELHKARLAEKEIEDNMDNEVKTDEPTMDLDKKRDKKTLLDENGQYPVWVNSRQAKRMRGIRKEKKKNKLSHKSNKNKQMAW